MLVEMLPLHHHACIHQITTTRLHFGRYLLSAEWQPADPIMAEPATEPKLGNTSALSLGHGQ